MKMKRKILSLVAVLLVAASILAVPASAVDTASEPGISLCYEDVCDCYVSIGVSDSGKASCYCWARTYDSTDKIYITMSLQKYSSGVWWGVKSWSGSDSGRASLDKSYYVTKGYYYRTKAVFTVYTSDGHYIETVTTYSPATK